MAKFLGANYTKQYSNVPSEKITKGEQFGDVHVAEYREYIHSLLAFRPAFPEAIAESSTKWVLVSHVLTSNILFIYFPFSKLIHSVGTFAGNLIRSEV